MSDVELIYVCYKFHKRHGLKMCKLVMDLNQITQP